MFIRLAKSMKLHMKSVVFFIPCQVKCNCFTSFFEKKAERKKSKGYVNRYGSADVVEALLDAGCSPNLTDSELLTPLHIAAKKGFPEVAERLVHAEFINLVNAT